MDGVTVSVLGALVALAVAIVLILKKVQAYLCHDFRRRNRRSGRRRRAHRHS